MYLFISGLGVGAILGIWLIVTVYNRKITALVRAWTEAGSQGLIDPAYDERPSPNGAVLLLRTFEQTAKANAELINTLIRLDIGPEHIDQWFNAGKPNLFGRNFSGSVEQPKLRPIFPIDRMRLERALNHLEIAVEQAKLFVGDAEDGED